MSSKEKLFHIIFWACAFIAWIFWVEARIDLFSWFVDGYKDLGYVVTTNDKQLGWYIILSLLRGSYLILVLYFLGEKLSITKKEILLAPFWLAGFLSLDYLVCKGYYLFLSSSSQEGFRLTWSYDLFAITGIYLSLLLVGWTLKSARNWIVEFKNLKKLHQTQKSYDTLQRQLNPHFIFNTINSFYDIAVEEGNERIQSSILNLTETLRYSLDQSNKSKVSLFKEIDAIKSYIALQKERLGLEELELSTSFPSLNDDMDITPMILLNYVENAFQHGYQYGKASSINIDLIQNGNEIHFKIENSDHSLRANEDGGNAKTKRILELNYPGHHKLETRKEDGLYKLDLWMNLG